MADKKKMSDLVAIKTYFGYKGGQAAREFLKETQALSAEDKAELGQLCREELGEA